MTKVKYIARRNPFNMENFTFWHMTITQRKQKKQRDFKTTLQGVLAPLGCGDERGNSDAVAAVASIIQMFKSWIHLKVYPFMTRDSPDQKVS